MSRNKIIQTLIEHLESEAFLGGRWLPMTMPKPPERVPTQPQRTHPAPATQPPTRVSTPATNMAKESIPVPRKVTGENQSQLDQIAARVAACQKCDLHKTRKHTVPGEGNPSARIVFVGEAPGGDEDQQGRPFVGRAGQLLTNIIKAMGLNRDDVFICNVLKCRPPDNRDPSASEKEQCIGYLTEQLKTINPDIIIALGAHAARTLLNTDEAIGRLRGKIMYYQPADDMPPIKLVATYHPAYLLRNYTQEARGRVWDDMKKVLAELNLPIPEKKK